MKCPKKNNKCNPVQIFKAPKNNFICCGRNTDPHFRCDALKLCGNGIASEFGIELTEDEAILFNIALSHGLYEMNQERNTNNERNTK